MGRYSVWIDERPGCATVRHADTSSPARRVVAIELDEADWEDMAKVYMAAFDAHCRQGLLVTQQMMATHQQHNHETDQVDDMPGDLFRKVAVCSKGIKGFIVGRRLLPWGMAWVGVRQDNGGEWSSRQPVLIDEQPSAAAVAAAQAMLT